MFIRKQGSSRKPGFLEIRAARAMAVCLPDDFHPCAPISSSIPVKMKENSLQLLTGTLQHISGYCPSLQRLPACVCERQSETRGQRALTCASVFKCYWSQYIVVCVSVCTSADILKRCRVKVHVILTQLSPPQLFIKSLTALSAAV